MQIIKLIIIVIIAFTTGTNAQVISPWLYGQNHWMDKGDEGKRPGYLSMLWPKVEESGIKMVRIGGNGYENRFPDRKTLTAIIDSIRGIGAEPFLQVPSKYTAEEVTALISDFKYSNGKGVRFYSIGNEPLLHDKNKIEAVYEYVRRLAPAMKAVDPTIKIFIFDEADLNREAYQAVLGGNLDLTGKDENGNWLIDGISFHRYPFGANFDREDVIFAGPYDIRRKTMLLVEMMDKANVKHGRTGDDKLLWGLTEVNVTYANPDREISGFGNPSFLGGQFMAEMYGIGLEFGAFTVNPWCIVETDRIKTDFGFLGLPTEFHPRSSYYHTQMMALHMTGQFLPSASSNSYVKSIAAMSNNEISVMILNRDQIKDYKFDLILNKTGESPKPLLIKTDAGLDITISGTIPNQTTMMFVLSKTGEILKQYTYGLTHNLKNLPPDIQ
jgi:hypothetical protein